MKSTIISIFVALLLIGGAIFFTSKEGQSNRKEEVLSSSEQIENIQNVSIVDGKQIIEIQAKGGYTPRVSIAKAGTPTVLRFSTSGTFDCSSSVRIPSMNISKILANRGTTDIDLGVQNVGVLQGVCGMGMYPFQIEFK